MSQNTVLARCYAQNTVLTLCYVSEHSPHSMLCLRTQSSLYVMSQNTVLTLCHVSEHSPTLLCVSKHSPYFILCLKPKFSLHFVAQYRANILRKYKLHQITVSQISLFCIHQTHTEQLITTLLDDTQENRIKHRLFLFYTVHFDYAIFVLHQSMRTYI